MVGLLSISAATLVFILPLYAVLFRGLLRARLGGFALRLGGGALALIGVGIAIAAALGPQVEQDIAACEAGSGYDCEDAGLVIVIVVAGGVIAAIYWIALAAVTGLVGLVLRRREGRVLASAQVDAF